MATELQKIDGTRAPSTRRVWDRSLRCEVDFREDHVPGALARGQIDLCGPDALPVDKTRVVGGPSAGNGDATADVLMVTGNVLDPRAVRRLPLLVAANVVKARLGVYVDAAGHPVTMPQADREPVITSGVPAEQAKPASRGRLRRLASRIANGSTLL